MQPAEIVHNSLFRERPGKKSREDATQLAEEEAEEQSPEEEEYILCRQCRQAITRPAERITIQGAHHHTFANPHGIVYEIGCFRSAQGCGYAGPATDEFSWFKGFHWRIAVCRTCLTHLGWLFTSSGTAGFNGLILDRLIES